MKAWKQRADECMRRLRGVTKPVMAEVGVGYCRMARVMLAAHPRLRLVMVDSFLPEDAQPECYKATRDNFAKRDLASCYRDLKMAEELVRIYADRTKLLHMDSREAARKVEDGSLDLAFLDADHSYEGVKRDIAAWLPKVKRGGWLGGHDYANPDERFDFSGVDRAVTELVHNFGFRVEFGANFTWFVRL